MKKPVLEGGHWRAVTRKLRRLEQTCSVHTLQRDALCEKNKVAAANLDHFNSAFNSLNIALPLYIYHRRPSSMICTCIFPFVFLLDFVEEKCMFSRNFVKAEGNK